MLRMDDSDHSSAKHKISTIGDSVSKEAVCCVGVEVKH